MLLHDIATSTEEVADRKHKLDSLCQDLEHVEPDLAATQSDGIVIVDIGSVRKKLKLYAWISVRWHLAISRQRDRVFWNTLKSYSVRRMK